MPVFLRTSSQGNRPQEYNAPYTDILFRLQVNQPLLLLLYECRLLTRKTANIMFEGIGLTCSSSNLRHWRRARYHETNETAISKIKGTKNKDEP